MLFDQISKDIVAAMKAKDKVRLEALRNIKKLFLEAKTAPGAGDGPRAGRGVRPRAVPQATRMLEHGLLCATTLGPSTAPGDCMLTAA